jgi:hypothetical protein
MREWAPNTYPFPARHRSMIMPSRIYDNAKTRKGANLF